LVFFFPAEDGIRDFHVTGVQTCALPISPRSGGRRSVPRNRAARFVEKGAIRACRVGARHGPMLLRKSRVRRGAASNSISEKRVRSEERRVGEGGAHGRRGTTSSRAQSHR